MPWYQPFSHFDSYIVGWEKPSYFNEHLAWPGKTYFILGLVVRKPVIGVSAKASFKPVSSATETSKNIEISPVASLHILLS